MTQEKRNRLLAISFIVLVVAILVLWLLRSDKNDGEVPRDLYSGYDGKSVDRIVLEVGNEKTELKFEGYRWRVNNSFNADRNLIQVLFATLAQAEPKRPVAQSLRDSVAEVLRGRGVKVSVFSGEALQANFFAGGNEAKTQSFFMMPDGEPHLVVIPGYRVYVSGIFELPTVAWRDKLIFNFNWQNFSSLQAEYRNAEGNFEVEMCRNEVIIPGIEADTAKLNTYMDQVSLLTVDEYITHTKQTDSLSAGKPVVNLTVTDISGQKYELDVFAGQNDFYGRINGEIWAILNKNRIFPLLRPKEFFQKR